MTRRGFVIGSSALMVGIGAVLLVQTALLGGGLGYLIGGLFVLVGAGRIYLARG